MLFADLHLLLRLRLSGAISIPHLSFLACTVLACHRVVVLGLDEALSSKE
jgi:hypothetical protein